MKSTLTLLFILCGIGKLLAQNVGINQNSPTNTLHIVPLTGEPIRIEGLTALQMGDSSLLIVNPASGVVRYINTRQFIDSVTSNITSSNAFLDSITSIIYNQGDTLLYNSLFISSLADSIDTDVDSLVLTGNILSVWENGNPYSVNLSSITGGGSDNWGTQVVVTGGTGFSGNGTTLSPLVYTEIDGVIGNEYNTGISVSGGNLIVTDGGGNVSVPLSALAGINTDSQNLTSSVSAGNATINISGGTGTTFSINDADNDPTNEIELPSTATTGQVLTYNGTNWVAQSAGSGADNWGTQTVVTGGTGFSGNGTSGSPLTYTEIDASTTNELNTGMSVSGGNLIVTDAGGNVSVPLTALSAINTDNQDISLTGNILSLTNDATTVNLAPYLDNTDNQNLTSSVSGSNATINISGGTGTTFSINDADSNPNNEFQTISATRTTSTTDLVIGIAPSGNSVTVNDGDWQLQALGTSLVAIPGGSSDASGGGRNVIAGNGNTITGATTSRSVISGGINNSITSGQDNTIGGGTGNSISAAKSVIGGGDNNNVLSFAGVIAGGNSNTTGTGSFNSLVGGTQNYSNNGWSFVGGGWRDTANAQFSVVVGGNNNKVVGNYGTIVGGTDNYSSGIEAFIGGGDRDTAIGNNSVVVGGLLNKAQGNNSTVGGGQQNKATGFNSTIGGGEFNNASGQRSVISGGGNHLANQPNTTISGGNFNSATGQNTTVSGGTNSKAFSYSEWVGGSNNTDYAPASRTIKIVSDRIFTIGNGTLLTDQQDALTVLKNGNLIIGTDWSGINGTGTRLISGQRALLINRGSQPGSLIGSNKTAIWNNNGEIQVKDELNNVTTISPHNFNLIPMGASEEMAWSFYSERNNKAINVDMTRLARIVEQISGEKIIFIKDLNTGEDLESNETKKITDIQKLKEDNLLLKNQIESQQKQIDELKKIVLNLTK